MRFHAGHALVLAALASTACSSDDAATKPGGAADGGAGGADAGSRGRLAVTADFLNRSISILDLDALIDGATTRDAALVATVDLSEYAPGPLEVAVTPDGTTAVVTVGPGFFAGAVGALLGATNVDTGGALLLVDLATHAVTKLSPPAGPMGVVITRDGTRAFSVDHGSTEGETLTVVDLEQRAITDSIVIGGGPEEAALMPDDSLGVVNTDSNESVRFFDPADPAGTMSAPLLVGADPGGMTFVPREKKVVIGQSLDLGKNTGVPGYSVIDVSDPTAPEVIEAHPLASGIPYGANLIPGTSHVLVTVGISGCELHEVDVSVNPSVVARVITLPCETTRDDGAPRVGFPMSTAFTRDGKHAFTGVMGDESLMVVDLESGTARRIPWLPRTGPTGVAIVD